MIGQGPKEWRSISYPCHVVKPSAAGRGFLPQAAQWTAARVADAMADGGPYTHAWLSVGPRSRGAEREKKRAHTMRGPWSTLVY